ncbi:MAG: hypothetical protein AAF205_09425 [Pseudomonadota bacterium]
MFATQTNVLRSLIGMVGAVTMTATVLFGALGPDPRADNYTSTAAVQVAAIQSAGRSAA